jgi:hypothetical protein
MYIECYIEETMKIRYLLLLLLSALFFACDLGTGTGTSTPTTPSLAPTPLQVEVEIRRSIDPIDNTTGVDWYFSIKYNGAIVDTATIMVNSTPVPVRYAFYSYYTLNQSEGATYFPGAAYTISVTYNGTTYTETMVAPGDITINADYTQVSWNYGGGYSVIGVDDYTTGAPEYQEPGSLGALTSPHTIPASAYPTKGDTYTLYVNIGSLKRSFGTLHGSDTSVWMSDFTRRRFTKN